MVWILVDIALVLLSLGLLGWSGLRLWRHVKALGRSLSALGVETDRASDALAGLGEHRT
ncbi:MAG: hypothetical protein JWL64_1356 [Frankiales bacterium]|nr:hypothetical protein [Frankiales bacterium]